MTIIQLLGRLRQKDCVFEVSLGNIETPCLNTHTRTCKCGWTNELINIVIEMVYVIIVPLGKRVLQV